MTSTELRRIVGAMTPELIAQVRHDLEFDAHRADTVTAIVTLANHADAFVKLVEACERWRDGYDIAEPILAALAAVHATRGTP